MTSNTLGGSGAEPPAAPDGADAAACETKRLQHLGQLASGVAHDFNNLLTVIQACVDHACALLPEDSPIRRDLADAQAASRQGARLVAQLLARHPPGNAQSLDLAAMLHDNTGLLARVVGGDIDLHVDAAPDLWPVRADPAAIWQLVFNLVINARDAMPDGGDLVLQTRNEVVASPNPAVRPALAAGSYVVLRVRDSGAGMDAATQMHMFEPHFTTKGPEGTGLGLATVSRIVGECGGGIRVDSRKGSGSTFEVYLPRARR